MMLTASQAGFAGAPPPLTSFIAVSISFMFFVLQSCVRYPFFAQRKLRRARDEARTRMEYMHLYEYEIYTITFLR